MALPAGVVLPTAGWHPTLATLTASALPAALAGGDKPLAVRFTAVSGSRQVDDVFVDPSSRG